MLDREKIRRVIESCGGGLKWRFDEPMAAHTTFQAGGPADCWVKPDKDSFPECAAALFAAAREENVPLFILGGGANILVSDKGIRGIVLDTSAWTGITGGGEENTLTFRSGTSLDAAADAAAAAGLAGLEFLAGMPGSVGGALYMNARAYEQEIAGVLVDFEVLDFSAAGIPRLAISADKSAFDYKRSPFQTRPWFVLSARFALEPRDKKEIHEKMAEYRRDRETKGHYRYPSAGSAFKNDRSFGKPVGKIIDELGLRGLRNGGAQIAPFHGNIIINTGGASAADIRALLEETASRVKKETGFSLEPEIILAGDWQ